MKCDVTKPTAPDGGCEFWKCTGDAQQIETD